MVEVPIPETAPVMVLPECNFFPQTPLPLYIFEPRYRAMLALALESDRMFCIGTPVHPNPEARVAPVDEEAGVYQHATLGLIRACVTKDDGTSNLLLEGLRRVQFTGWVREKPFRIAALQSVDTVVSQEGRLKEDAIRLTALSTALIDRGVHVQHVLKEQLQTTMEPEALADLVANYLMMDIHARHRLLTMADLSERMNFLIAELKGQLGALGPPPK